MRSVPFHRRIIPWIFAIAFIALAPTVIFYTSGYRYDAKRGKVERNGTIIFDSQPSGAQLYIDGRASEKRTPVTIQDMAPGSHAFELRLPGYAEWKKNLDITPERVTFADQIQLWPKSEPNLFIPTQDTRLFSSTDQSRLLLTNASGTAQAVRFTQLPTFRISATNTLSEPIPTNALVHWSDDYRFALVEAVDGQTTLLDITDATKALLLPQGHYRWEGKVVIGTDGKSMITITREGSLSRTPLEKDHIDTMDDLVLQEVDQHAGRILTSPDQPGKGFVLPPGHWHFWGKQNDVLLLRDGTHWLALSRMTGSDSYHSSEAIGKTMQVLRQKNTDRAVLLTENELWLWNFLSPPELLYRQSEPLVDARWHPKGNHVFIANQRAVSVIELDARDGRMWTELATFDRVHGISFYSNQLFILGIHKAQSGLWSLKTN